ncbi:unnamed protein product [Cuscuta campestris]|uniref:Uncharacterized protein n=1 Tax=Cuscuta campestris TaxID=132261 RepID=A0A484NC46_9ASTE|nr:unnamed protein product [Cuscuta campestris]
MKEATEVEKKGLRDEVARLAKELLEKKSRSSNLARELLEEKSHSSTLERENRDLQGCSAWLEEEKNLLSSEVGSISARVVELEEEKVDLSCQLEAEKGDLARLLEEAVETFKASPKFAAIAMGHMNKLVHKWVVTKPEGDWWVEKAKKSFQCGLFQAQQVFRSKLAMLPKGLLFPISASHDKSTPQVSSILPLIFIKIFTISSQVPFFHLAAPPHW